MSVTRTRLSAAALLLPLVGSFAQTHGAARPDPVHWTADTSLPRSLQAGGRFRVLLHATIDPGWHLYALPERDAFPLATEVALARTDEAELLEVSQASPRHSIDPDSHIVTAWFAQAALFTLRLTSTSPHPPRALQVLVRYQVCNDRMCLPPKNEAVPVTIFR